MMFNATKYAINGMPGITNQWNPRVDADGGYGLISGHGYCQRMRNPHIRALIGGQKRQNPPFSSQY
uniref:Uncharacterized protein n=1 Tax=Romanomermis culicivorax TaxID=13658 RepID=A0A915K6V5_ROMCU